MKNNKGFSLVELIIVIAIMAVLIGVLAPQFIKYVERSRESTDLQNLEEMKTTVETYVADHGEETLDDIEVTLKNGDHITCSLGSKLAEYGIADTGIKVKSSKWKSDYKLTYPTSGTNAYKWNIPAGEAVYFNLDGTAKSN